MISFMTHPMSMKDLQNNSIILWTALSESPSPSVSPLLEALQSPRVGPLVHRHHLYYYLPVCSCKSLKHWILGQKAASSVLQSATFNSKTTSSNDRSSHSLRGHRRPTTKTPIRVRARRQNRFKCRSEHVARRKACRLKFEVQRVVSRI